MSLAQAIAHGQEHRKGYAERGKPGGYDATCRPHGGGYSRPCPWCENQRLLKGRLQDLIAREQLSELKNKCCADD